MSTLTTTRNFATGTVLYKSDFNDFLNDIETFFNTTKITDGNIQGVGIDASLKLADASITTAKMADANVTTVKIGDGAVETINIADANITTAKIVDGAVTTAKIADANVTTAKIADGAITQIKKEAVDYAAYGSNSTIINVTENNISSSVASVIITGSGRPILLYIQNSNGTSFTAASTVRMCWLNVIWRRSGTLIGKSQIGYNVCLGSTPAKMPLNMMQMIDVPSAGTYTYSIDIEATSGGAGDTSISINGLILIAMEL